MPQTTIILSVADKELWREASDHLALLNVEANCIRGFALSTIQKHYKEIKDISQLDILLNIGTIVIGEVDKDEDKKIDEDVSRKLELVPDAKEAE